MSKKTDEDYTDISTEDINSVIGVLRSAARKAAEDSDVKTARLFELAITAVNSYLHLVSLIQLKKTKLKTLRRLLFGSKSERSPKDNNNSDPEGVTPDKSDDDNNNEGGSAPNTPGATTNNVPNDGSAPSTQGPDDNKDIYPPSEEKRKGGGGKNGHEAYSGSTEIRCPLCESKSPGSICPECNKHKLYTLPEVTTIRLMGSAPVTALKFIQERSGCTCGMQYLGDPPSIYEDILYDKKYSPSALSSIIHQKFDLGVPYGALGTYQENLGIPLPASTQSNKIREVEYVFSSIFERIQQIAANMDLVGFDDTGVKILEGRENKDGEKSIKGHGSVFVCSNIDNEKVVVLYYLNFDHAGKELLKFLNHRSEDSAPMISICDGLGSYETPVAQSKVEGCNCNTHARRKFFLYDENDFLCNIIIESYKVIYKNEKKCKELDYNATARMEYHAKNSTDALDNIYDTCKFITLPPNSSELLGLREKLNIPEYVIPSEPNSDLNTYGKYVLKRWKELTNFIKIPGVPLDTNYVERMVKSIIEVRKKGLFFKTLNSAINAGKILSVLETAKINKVNSFDYVEFLLTHPEEASKNPSIFLPWNYQANRLYSVKKPLTILPEMMPSYNHRSSVAPGVHAPP